MPTPSHAEQAFAGLRVRRHINQTAQNAYAAKHREICIAKGKCPDCKPGMLDEINPHTGLVFSRCRKCRLKQSQLAQERPRLRMAWMSIHEAAHIYWFRKEEDGEYRFQGEIVVS